MNLKLVVIRPLFFMVGLYAFLLGSTFSLHAQGFHFPVREQSSGLLSASALRAACVNNAYPTTALLFVSHDQRSAQLANASTFNSKVQYKSNYTLVRFMIAHEADTLPKQPYVYRLVFKLEGSKVLSDSTVSFTAMDTIVIGYNGDSLTAYQDQQVKVYSGLYNAKLTIMGVYDATALTPTLVPCASLAKNFNIELAMQYQTYTKVNSLSDMNLITSSTYDAATGLLQVNWNYANTPFLGKHTPAQYDLEWTYVDDYGDQNSTPLSSSVVAYNFKNNASRITTDSMQYKIPIVYPRGYVVFRVRMLRPDATQYRYPVYGNWNIAASAGKINTLSNGAQYYYVATPHLGDSLNWNYSIQFAEGGKYKHVLSYYDGLLKNRQTITRFNSSPDKLLVTEAIYDYEGRAAISTLPSVVKTATFKLQDSVAISSITGLPYQAIDFDKKPISCPDTAVLPPFALQSRSNFYYSTLNTDTFGAQKYVPQANGYPFVHTQLSPGFSDRVDKQGAPGVQLQINKGHDLTNYYVNAEQKNLNALLGLNAGMASYYNKTVSKDQNGQLSMAIKDFKGKLVANALLGTVDTVSQALMLNNEVPATKIVREDKLAGALQNVTANQKKWSGNQFMDIDANTISVQYEYNLAPLQVCASPNYLGLSVNASYDYTIHDPCGVLELKRAGSLGTTGVVTALPNPNAAVVDVIGMAKGNHTINKTLTVKTSDIQSAVDSFLVYATTHATTTCLKTENQFIKEAVDALQIPCGDYAENPCALLQKQMERELFPNHKYGVYTIQKNNPAGTTTVGQYPSIFDVGRKDDTITYRYASPCVINALNTISISLFGSSYANLASLAPDTFRYVYEHCSEADQYKIAEALLPLHPEYCKLSACFVDTFMERLSTLQTAADALRYGYFSMSDLLQKDSYLISKLMAAPYNLTYISDSLSTLYKGAMGIDTLALQMAYTSTDDSVAYKDALRIYKNAIATMSMTDSRTKDQYFTNLKQLYTTNHNKWINVLQSGGGNTCLPCANGLTVGRIPDVLPFPFVPVVYAATGGLSTAPGSVFASLTPAQQQQLNAILQTPTDTATLRIKRDSVLAMQKWMDSSKTNIAVDSIVAKLVNCFPSPLAQQKLHDTLLALFNRGQVQNGAFTPNQVRYAITASGNTLSDLCHPYLFNYDYVSNTIKGSAPGACKADAFYASAKNFLNEAIITTALRYATSLATTYNNPYYTISNNAFASAINAKLSGMATKLISVYDAANSTYRLLLIRNTDTVAIALHAKTTVKLNNQVVPAFSLPGFVNIQSAACYYSAADANADGTIGLYQFTVAAQRSDINGTTPLSFTGWTNGSIAMSDMQEGALAACVPCTQFKTIFKTFRDSMQVLSAFNADHPLFYTALKNFANYQLKSAYSEDQYRDFLQSCALADSMQITASGGWAKLSFAGSNSFANFQNANSVIPMQALALYKTGNTERVVIDNTSIPYAQLRNFRALVLNSGGTVNNTITSGMGTLVYPASVALSALLPAACTNFTPIAATLSIGGTSVPGFVVQVFPPLGANAKQISQSIAKLYANIEQQNATAFWLPNALATVNEDYYKPLKQQFLNYVYSAQTKSPVKVLDTLAPSYLATALADLNGLVPSYTSTSNPNDLTNLYYSNAAQLYPGYAMLTTILNEVKSNLNNALFLPNNSSVLQAVSSSGSLKLYRCQDDLYGYQYFKNGSLQMYNFYLRVPKIVYKNRHPNLLPVSVKLATGDTIVQRFVLNMIDPQYPSDTIAVQGSCDFALGWSSVLKQVLLGNDLENTPSDAVQSGEVGASTNCEQDRLYSAIVAGKVRYATYMDSTKTALYAALSNHVLQSAQEKLWIDYVDKRFAYTLYQYDLVGNLIKTVPPMGVRPLDSASIVPIDAMRASNTFNVAQVPDHKKTSRYEYNTANQLVREYTPDGGEKTMYYDAKGNLILSQNDKQRPRGLFTYCLYDGQNRIVETGEVTWNNCVYFADVPLYDANKNLTTPPNACACQNLNTSTWTYCMPSSQINFTDNVQFANLLKTKIRSQVVATVYDQEMLNLATKPGLSKQTNLRNRVAASVFYPRFIYGSNNSYTHATHYSYDAAGNVIGLVQDFPELATLNQQYKRVDYAFDLHSGKVNMLSYNSGKADQFYQRYNYDADNRIQSVETSHDGFIWKRDAGYTYYLHGPLARVSLGAQRVQGVDYAYTLQGWLKAINGSALDANLDMGGDGKAGNITPKDAYGTSLNYFNNDYAAIGASNWNNVPQQNKDLYNGNIARQTTALSVFGALTTAYTYDQQNRIRQAQYGSLNNQQVLDFNNWYASAYTYDLDGNLQSLVRHNSTGAVLDSFAYVYAAPSHTNKLSDVWDRAANLSGSYSDIKHSAAAGTRFLYDELGQLVKDQTSGTDTIQWNVYGKVSTVGNKTQKWTLRYGYDAAGQRVSKAQELSSDSGRVDKNSYYVRDAAGNILAVYELQNSWKPGSLLEAVQMGFAAIDPTVASSSGFSTASGFYVHTLQELGVLSDPGFVRSIQPHLGTALTAQTAGQVLSADASLQQQFLSNQPATLLRGLQAYSKAYSTYPIADVLAAQLQESPEQSLRLLLRGLFLAAAVADTALQQRTSTLASLVPGFLQQFAQDHGIDTSSAAKQLQVLKTVATGSSDYVYQSLLRRYQSEGITPLYAWLAIATSDSMQVRNDTLFGHLLHNALLRYSDAVAGQQAEQQQIDKSQAGIYAFANWWQGASTFINSVNADLLGQIAYLSHPEQAINHYLNSSNGDIHKVHEAVAANSGGAGAVLRIIDQLQIDRSQITNGKADVLKTQRFGLAEHHIYGSSRVGVSSYWPGQYDAVWDYTTKSKDTLRLLGIKPWYSATLEGYRPAGSTEVYGPGLLQEARAQHLLGQKRYELSNHLGNVQATLSDKRYVQKGALTATDSLRKGFAASVSSLYDYYPFGMLMQERCTSDTGTQTAYVSQVVYSPAITTVNNAMNGATVLNPNSSVQSSGNGSITYSGTTNGGVLPAQAGIKKVLSNLVPNVPVSVKINLVYASASMYIAVAEGSAQSPSVYSNLLYSTMSNGSINFTFTPTQPNVELSMKLLFNKVPSTAFSYSFTLDTVSYTQQTGANSSTQLVQISNKQSDKYRFGFNGQEKDNEIAGVGNHNTAEFWEYDTRVGRRWNTDPVVKPWESSYACFANNPIWYSDVNGDDGNKPNVIGKTKPKIYTISNKEISEKLESRQFVSTTGLSIEFAVALVQEEKVVLNLYDIDGNVGQGGNATIGIGYKVHTGAIGSSQFDKDALNKELVFKNGITVDKAFDLFVEGIKARSQTVNSFLKNANVSISDDGIKSALFDIYFNAGTKDLKNAINSYKTGGIEKLYKTISDGGISNPSESRKKLRLGLLNNPLKQFLEESGKKKGSEKKKFHDNNKKDSGKDRDDLREM